jgi:hypothetical protein
MLHLKDMATKKTIDELKKMSRNQMAHYIIDITQTEICKDKNYCNLLISIFIKK